MSLISLTLCIFYSSYHFCRQFSCVPDYYKWQREGREEGGGKRGGEITINVLGVTFVSRVNLRGLKPIDSVS